MCCVGAPVLRSRGRAFPSCECGCNRYVGSEKKALLSRAVNQQWVVCSHPNRGASLIFEQQHSRRGLILSSHQMANRLANWDSEKDPGHLSIYETDLCARRYLKYQGIFRTEMRSLPLTSKSVLSTVARCECRK